MLRFRFGKNNLSEVPNIRLVVSFGDCGCVMVHDGERKLDIAGRKMSNRVAKSSSFFLI